MTPNESLLLPGPWPDALAAYADGELDPAARAVVECWLAKHPEMLCSLHAQRHLSPDNWPLWQQVEPPLPSESAWNSVREAVHRGIESPPMPATPRRHNWWVRKGSYFAGGIAAAIALVLLASWFYPSRETTIVSWLRYGKRSNVVVRTLRWQNETTSPQFQT